MAWVHRARASVCGSRAWSRARSRDATSCSSRTSSTRAVRQPLDRPARRTIPVKIDLKGFTIPDRFVIGYGLDYAGLYRELPAIYSLG